MPSHVRFPVGPRSTIPRVLTCTAHSISGIIEKTVIESDPPDPKSADDKSGINSWAAPGCSKSLGRLLGWMRSYLKGLAVSFFISNQSSALIALGNIVGANLAIESPRTVDRTGLCGTSELLAVLGRTHTAGSSSSPIFPQPAWTVTALFLSSLLVPEQRLKPTVWCSPQVWEK